MSPTEIRNILASFDNQWTGAWKRFPGYRSAGVEKLGVFESEQAFNAMRDNFLPHRVCIDYQGSGFSKPREEYVDWMTACLYWASTEFVGYWCYKYLYTESTGRAFAVVFQFSDVIDAVNFKLRWT